MAHLEWLERLRSDFESGVASSRIAGQEPDLKPDGDGKYDVAVFRFTGALWFISRTTAGMLITSYGLSSDKPVPSAYVR